jgi:hypothetical protein
MRDLLHRRDFALHANVLTGIDVQLQSDKITGHGTVRPGLSGRFENGSLTTDGDLGSNDISLAESVLHISGDEWVIGHVALR